MTLCFCVSGKAAAAAVRRVVGVGYISGELSLEKQTSFWSQKYFFKSRSQTSIIQS